MSCIGKIQTEFIIIMPTQYQSSIMLSNKNSTAVAIKKKTLFVLNIKIKPLYLKSYNLYISRFLGPVHKAYNNLF